MRPRFNLGREDPLEKGMATYSSILALENPKDGRAWWATVHGVARGRHDLVTKPPPPPPDGKDVLVEYSVSP